jgi:predicted TPR repeat methyltransferase
MYFDHQAQAFDTPYRQARAKVIAAAIRQHILPKPCVAMEFGCGTGLIGMELMDCFSSLLFVDSSREMIRMVQEKISHTPSARAIQIDLTKEAMDDRFDFIFSSMVLHHIVDAQAILSVLRGLLRPGGRLVLVDLNPVDEGFHATDPDFTGHHGFDQQALGAMLKGAGFSAIQTNTFYKGVREMDGVSIPYSLFIARAKNP